MSKAHSLLMDFDLITSNARRVVERVTDDISDFRVHDSAMPLGTLAMQCATMPLMGVIILEDDGFDQKNREKRPRPDLAFRSREACVKQLDVNAAELRSAIARAEDPELNALWAYRSGDHMIMNESRAFTIRFLVLDHLVHQTAHVGIGLRLSGAKVPALYGPSADEQFSYPAHDSR